MRGAIPLRMIGQELIQNNNIICIYIFEKMNLFQLNKYERDDDQLFANNFRW